MPRVCATGVGCCAFGCRDSSVVNRVGCTRACASAAGGGVEREGVGGAAPGAATEACGGYVGSGGRVQRSRPTCVCVGV